MDLYIMKLGGSVATHKSKNQFKVNEKVIKSVARQIKSAQQKKKFRLVLVNGAGPFGHRNVHEYRINQGVKTKKEFEGFCKTVIECNFLNQKISELFWKEGLLAYPLPVSAITIQKNKKIRHQDYSVLQALFRQNNFIIPILNGTMCPDETMGASVVSGDATIAELAKQLKPKKIVLGTDVSGIFSADPKKDRNAKRVSFIGKKNWKNVLSLAEGSASMDVTGGMKGKLMKLRSEIGSAQAIIFDATQPQSTFKALMGQKQDCTRVQF